MFVLGVAHWHRRRGLQQHQYFCAWRPSGARRRGRNAALNTIFAGSRALWREYCSLWCRYGARLKVRKMKSKTIDFLSLARAAARAGNIRSWRHRRRPPRRRASAQSERARRRSLQSKTATLQNLANAKDARQNILVARCCNVSAPVARRIIGEISARSGQTPPKPDSLARGSRCRAVGRLVLPAPRSPPRGPGSRSRVRGWTRIDPAGPSRSIAPRGAAGSCVYSTRRFHRARG
jgi:hypothetical protein